MATTRKAKKGDEKVKCPGCQMYWVEPGTLCANCEKKQEEEVGDDADELDAE